jgi:hypothetical protein
MAEFATNGEFDQLVTRVDVVEREVEGEKLVTRHILEQTAVMATTWPRSGPASTALRRGSMESMRG